MVSHSSERSAQQPLSCRIPSRPVSSLAEAYAYCRRVTRQSSSNFYYAFRLLSKTQHDALCAVYAFCRFIDDITDQAEDAELRGGTSPSPQILSRPPQHRTTGKSRQEILTDMLNLWREELDYCYRQQPRYPISQALADTVQHFPIKREHLTGIIDGVEMDLHQTRYQTFHELYDYCYHVACLVGLVCIEIFGYQNAKAQEYAVNLGLAFQLTNIIRDVAEDASRDRIYLPAEDLHIHGYSEQELRDGVYNDAFVCLMRFEEERARKYYQRATESLPKEDRQRLAASEAMHLIYRQLLDKIAARRFQVFETRVRLSTWRKLGLALQAWGHSRFAL